MSDATQQESESTTDSSADLPIDFTSFILSLSTSALLHLGESAEEGGIQPKVDLPMAKHEIGILEMLQEKTSGNLTTEEAGLLQQALYHLRLRYVDLTKES